MTGVRDIFLELRRRKVFRVAGLYVVASWVAVQVASLIFPAINIADVAIRYVWIGVIFTFPLAVMFAWLYDITLDGIVRTPPADDSTDIDLGLRRTDYLILALLVVIGSVMIIQLGGEIQEFKTAPSGPPSTSILNADTIVVLPLENVSNDISQQFFVEGMHDALISVLSGISALKVISRSSARRYVNTDKSLIEIGRDLGAASIIEGSVFRHGDDIRISVQLIDAASGQLKWANSYDRKLREVLRLQSELARSIADEVEVLLTPEESTYLASAEQVVPDAYESYLKGRFHWYRFTQKDLDIAIEYFQSAIDSDPGYALAYVGLADALATQPHIGLMPATEVFPQAIELLKKALELDPLLAEAHDLSARIKFVWDFDWLGADRGFRESIRLKASHPDARIVYSQFLGIQQRWEESLEQVRAGLSLDPFNDWFRVELGERLSWMGQYDEALVEYLRIAEDQPNWYLIHRSLWEIYFYQGELDRALDAAKVYYELKGEARLAEIAAAYDGQTEFPAAMQALATEMLAAKSHSYLNDITLARLFAFSGDIGQTLDWLERAHAHRDSRLVYSAAIPLFALVWDQPRFAELRRKMNLPDPGADR